MATALTIIEPLKLPDTRRPATMPSLPEWAALRIGSLKENWQSDPATGQGRMCLTLPQAMILGASERAVIEQHVTGLNALLEQTPEKSADCEAGMLVAVTKMLKVLPSQRSDATGYEARGEAYLGALDDVPTWAVEEAIRRWYRKDCGEKHNYTFAPGPGDLREASLREVYRVRGRIRQLRGIATAVPLIEFSDEHCAMMLGRLSKVLHSAADIKPIDNDGIPAQHQEDVA